LYTYYINKDTNKIVFVTSAGAMNNPPTGAKFLENWTPDNINPFLLGESALTLENGNGGCVYESKGCKLIPFGDTLDYFVSAYAPIRNSKGESIGAIGIDFEADYITEIKKDIFIAILNNFILTYTILLILVYISNNGLNKLVSRLKKKRR
jgi:hypothetical protein